MAVTFQQPQNLSNLINELTNITGQGNFNQQMKLPKPVIPQGSVRPSGGIGGLGEAVGAFPGQKLPAGYVGGPGTPSQGGGNTLDKLVRAIRSQESGNNYRATNPSGASGAYQILRSNFEPRGRGWDMEALGRDVSLQEFMNSPQIQDAIARYKMGQYLKNYGGDAAKVAVAWYGGPGAVKNMYSTRTQTGGYPSLAAYWQSVLNKM